MVNSVSPAKIARPQEFLHQLKLDEVFVFPYILAVAWQYFWSLPNKTVGWALATFISLGIWYVYVLIKPRDDAALTRWFWAIVVPPLIFIFVLRVLVPDTSWDESTITWDTRPAFGNLLGTSGALAANQPFTVTLPKRAIPRNGS